MNWTPIDETPHYPDDWVIHENGGPIYERPPWYLDMWLRIQLNGLQAYTRGFRRIVSHADLKPLPDLCIKCDNYTTGGDLCDACNYHKAASVPLLCRECGVLIPTSSRLVICADCHIVLDTKMRQSWKQKPKRVPKHRLHHIIFDFLNDLAIYIEERLS